MRLFNKQLKAKEEQQQLFFNQLETTNSKGHTCIFAQFFKCMRKCYMRKSACANVMRKRACVTVRA